MAGPGHDLDLVLPDGRVLEYWDGGDPAGLAMVVHPGTPETRVMGRWGHDAAVSAGVRLIALNRPGYGGSTPIADASLARTGSDTAALAAHLGLDEYAVFGLSGGGPFAIATAIADPSRVRALGVVGGIGPWRIIDPARDPDGTRCLTRLDAGDVAGARDCMHRDVELAYGAYVELDDAARADRVLARIGEGSRVSEIEAYRAIWADNMRVFLASFDGMVFDNLAWGARWDIDPGDVAAPTLLLYGGADQACPAVHGRWLADRIAKAELVVLPGERHLDVIDGHWPEVLAGLLALWAST